MSRPRTGGKRSVERFTAERLDWTPEEFARLRDLEGRVTRAQAKVDQLLAMVRDGLMDAESGADGGGGR